MFSHTSARIVESRNRVGGERTFVMAGAQRQEAIIKAQTHKELES